MRCMWGARYGGGALLQSILIVRQESAALCMTAGHKDHSVVNIAEQRNIILKSRALTLIRQLGVNKSRLIATRRKC